jgi:uncharacterized protein involved in exopolysaccharide biosynthesis
MKLTATQLRKIIKEEVKRTKRLHEAAAPELDAGLIKQDMVSILNAYEGLNDHLSGELEDGLFEELMRDISSAKSLLEDLLDNEEELRALGGSNVSRPGLY